MADAVETGRALIQQAQQGLQNGKRVAVHIEGREKSVDVSEATIAAGDHVARLVPRVGPANVWYIALRSVFLVIVED